MFADYESCYSSLEKTCRALVLETKTAPLHAILHDVVDLPDGSFEIFIQKTYIVKKIGSLASPASRILYFLC